MKFKFKKKPGPALRERTAEQQRIEQERRENAAGRRWRFTETNEFFEGVEGDADERGELDL